MTNLVKGETCPALVDVEQRVRVILHLSDERPLNEGVVVERREAGLFVELRGVDGGLIGERVLPKEGSCDDLAQVAAVVLSAWLSDVHPDFAGDLPTPVVEAPREAEPTPPPSVEPPPKPVVASLPVRAAARAPWGRWELNASVGGSLTGETVALAGSVGAALLSPRGWGVRALTMVDKTRREPLGDGSVVWRRWPIALGPTLRLDGGALRYDFTLAPALSWLRVSGTDFAPNRSRSALTWAALLDARVGSRGEAGIFVGLQAHAYLYLVESSAYVGQAEYPLPRFVLSLLVGGRVAP